jgi:CheY-like chemotaxis protein
MNNQPSDHKEDENHLDKYVGYRLREKRIRLNLKLTDISGKLRVSHQQIQKYERGQTRISASALFSLSQLLGVNPNYFFEGYTPTLYNTLSRENAVQAVEKTERLNIFVIEDDPGDELLLRRALDASPYKTNIFSAHDGSKALEFLKNRNGMGHFPRPHIILLDLNIPKRSGLEVLREIKRDREIQDIPVIIMTHSINASEMVGLYRNYAAGYISKLFNFEEFQESILGMVHYWAKVVVLPQTA